MARDPGAEIRGPATDYDEVRPAVLLPNGQPAILDTRLNLIRFYDHTGRQVDSVGSPLPSGGYLRYPAALAIGANRDLWILDRGKTIKRFRTTPSGTYTFASEFPVTHRVDAFCVIDTVVVVRGYGEDNAVVHTYTPAGQLIAAFGESYRDSVPLVRRQLSRGTVGCDPITKTIAVAYDNLPVVRAYSLDGRHVWTNRWPDYAPIRTTSSFDGTETVTRFADPPFDRVSSVQSIGDGLYLAEITHYVIRSRDDRHRSFRHVLIDARSGAMAPIPSDTAISVLAVREGSLLSLRVPSLQTYFLLKQDEEETR